ncbi:unnamed protein product [Camellia sinensis]
MVSSNGTQTKTSSNQEKTRTATTYPFSPSTTSFCFEPDSTIYGNCDGLSKPPSFRLDIDGKFWANVTASMSEEQVYHELLYIIKGGNVTVCLVQTTDDEVPLEANIK